MQIDVLQHSITREVIDVAIVATWKDGNTTIRIADDCIKSPEQQKRIWENVERIVATALLEQERKKRQKEKDGTA